jgi:hypothetical protein
MATKRKAAPPSFYPDDRSPYITDIATQGNAARRGISIGSQKNNPDLKKKLNDTLYKRVAKEIGITNLSSWNDVKKIEDYLLSSKAKDGKTTGGQPGTSTTGSGSSGSSGGSSSGGSKSGSSGSKSGSAGGDLKSQQALGQSTADKYASQQEALQKTLEQLSMASRDYNTQFVEAMNRQSVQAQMDQSRQNSQLQSERMLGLMQFGLAQHDAQMNQLQAQRDSYRAQQAQQEQARIAENVGRASIPEPIQTAGFTPVGDMRASGPERKRSQLSSLSDLVMLPGSSSVTNTKSKTNLLVAA